jgi:hypothetical protein
MVKCCASFIVLMIVCVAAVSSLGQYADAANAKDLPAEGNASMPQETTLNDLFDRWERVWHEGQYDLIPDCVGSTYIRHDEAGDRKVTREAYASEIAKTRQDRPNLRFVVYDHTFQGDRAWFRFTLKWTDAKTGEMRTRAGMQVYRIEAGKLAETWLQFQPLGSAWTDTVAQEHWTSPPNKP